MESNVTEQVLTRQDRCDADCDAQARVLVKGISGELLFCGHHYAKNEDKLIEFSYEVIDEREFIN